MTSDEFNNWLHTARPGEQRVYHQGSASVVSAPEGVKRAAMEAWEAKRCLLFQRRISEGCYEYVAIACTVITWDRIARVGEKAA